MKSLAASISWKHIEAAIQVNPSRHHSLFPVISASSSIAVMPAETALAWLPDWEEDSTLTLPDMVALSLWLRDPLYRSATPVIRRQMEMEEAGQLLLASEAAWKTQHGRTRGWVRKHLEEDLRQRSGGAEAPPDFWESVRTQKRTAHLVDYICIQRGLRVALWWPDQNGMTVIPHTGQGSGVAVAQLNCTSCRVMVSATHGFSVPAPQMPVLLLTSKDISWFAPASAPSLGTLTVAQIQERLKALDPAADCKGNRAVLWNRYMWRLAEQSLTQTSEDST